MHSIKAKITTMTVVAIVIATVIATTLGVIAIQSIGTSSSEQVLRLLCETSQRNINSYFSSVEQSVEIVSSFVEGDLKGLETEQLAEHVEHMRTVFAETANNTMGALTYYYRIDPSVSDTVKGFWYVNTDKTAFKEHEVTDITLYDTEDTSQLVWFTVPKATGKALWLQSYITDNLDIRVISYNMPVYFRGQFIGVIGIEIDYSTMAGLVDNIRLYENGYAFINDNEGNILYHPRMDVLSMSEEEKPKVPENLITESTVTRYNYEGTGKIGVWLPLRNGTRLNVAVPVSEINGNWSQLVTTIICVAAVLLAVFVILAHHITGRITKPLTDLTDAAREVVGGNYDISLPYQGDDEAGVLTSAFRQLIAHLKTYIQDLHDLAYGDALTAVRNKGAFDIYLKGLQEQIDNPEANPEFAICFFDCNDLKAINDTYGHEKGDMYLKNSCTMICQVFAHSPVFRIGGDEFAAVLTKGDYEHRDRLLALFDQRCYDLRAIGEQPWEQVNTARGIAVFNPRTDMTTEDVVRRADESMYANKKSMKQ